MKKAKRVKVYGKINLYETSVVGIPAYPDAHASTTTSLCKALHKGFTDEGEEIDEVTVDDLDQELNEVKERLESDTQLNTEEAVKETMEENSTETDVNKFNRQEAGVVLTPEPIAHKTPEKETKEQKVEAPKRKSAEEDMQELVADAIKKGIKEGLEKLNTERGLVEETPQMKPKSLGELALSMCNK